MIHIKSFGFGVQKGKDLPPLPTIIREPHDPTRVRRFRASDDTVDRYDEVILADGWDFADYIRNPVVMLYHKYDDLPVGKATAIGVRDGALYIDVEFDPEHIDARADTVLRKIDHGTISAGSVGFIPIKCVMPNEDKELFEKYPGARRIYTKCSLLEWTITPVPANPNALAAAMNDFALRGFGPSRPAPDDAAELDWGKAIEKADSILKGMHNE